VINERQLEDMLAAVERARAAGRDRRHGRRAPAAAGFYIAPTIVEGAAPRLGDLVPGAVRPDHDAAPAWAASTRRLEVANASPYGLTAAIWTEQRPPGQEFVRRSVAAVCR
jgi:aminomuconate-semialdehyde/2-hydroxymuconate-6-semialdehyde dehydrogenase